MSYQQDFLEDLEVLTVETPEALELRLPLAGFGPRFLALLLDSLIQVAIYIVVLVVLFIILFSVIPALGQSESSMLLLLVLVIIALALVNVGYFTLFETIWRGQTPGKRATGIRVMQSSGLPITFRDALLRNLFRIVDNLPSNGLIGLISFFASAKQQRIGDLVAGTVVVREYRAGLPQQAPLTGSASYPEAGTAVMTPRLSYVISSYLARCNGFSVEDRLTLTSEIIRQMGYEARMMNLREREYYLHSALYGTAGGAR